MLGRPVQKLLLQFLVTLSLPHPEGHVHAATAGLLYRAPGETRQFLLIILICFAMTTTAVAVVNNDEFTLHI